MNYNTLLQAIICYSFTATWFSDAFLIGTSGPPRIDACQTVTTTFDSTVLFAKKKRRRRKNPSSPSNDKIKNESKDSVVSSNTEISGDLPDFDLPEFDLEDDSSAQSSEPKKAVKVDINFDEITDVMMGDSSKPEKSLEQLISDRSLESKLEFDEVADSSIPDFTSFAKASSSGGEGEPATMGKKKARQAERRAAAILAKEEEEEVQLNLPFVSDEEGNVSAIKVLEAGAWLGIFLLIGWEIYLNSPFFERSAPMAPVVFELYM